MVASIANSCRDSRLQRALPDEIICIRANNRMSLTRSQRALISLASRRLLSNHPLSASAEDADTRTAVTVPRQTARIIKTSAKMSCAALIDVNQMVNNRESVI